MHVTMSLTELPFARRSGRVTDFPATNGSYKLSLYKPTLYMFIQLARNQFQLQSQFDISRREKHTHNLLHLQSVSGCYAFHAL